MTAAQSPQPPNATRTRSNRTFASVLISIGVSLLVLGVAGFGYLRVHSPAALLSSSSRSIAAATMFVPRKSPFTISLLTRPEKLIALQQAVTSPEYRPKAEQESAQLQRSLTELSGLDYLRDIQPWAGEEITFAYTSTDRDQDKANGQQPGYLLAIEIAPGKRALAQDFLQSFWQQQALVGSPPQSQQISGVPILSSPAASAATSSAKLTAATALIGSEFILFSNATDVIRNSIHSAQSADNLAQDPPYRTAAEQLPEPRIALAYCNTRLLSRDGPTGEVLTASDSFAAVSVGITRTGLTADVRAAGNARTPKTSVSRTGAVLSSATLNSIPESSQVVISGDHVDSLKSAFLNMGVPDDILPSFLILGSSQEADLWDYPDSDYVLAKLGSLRGGSADWLLAVGRSEESVEALDKAAVESGYSVVPVQIADRSATAWTRFKARLEANSNRRRSGNGLETELLGLHLQQGDTEVFASSLEALESALIAADDPISGSQHFQQAIASVEPTSEGYLYIDGPAVSLTAKQLVSLPDTVWRTARPLTDHIRAIAATRNNNKASIFVQLDE